MPGPRSLNTEKMFTCNILQKPIDYRICQELITLRKKYLIKVNLLRVKAHIFMFLIYHIYQILVQQIIFLLRQLSGYSEGFHTFIPEQFTFFVKFPP